MKIKLFAIRPDSELPINEELEIGDILDVRRTIKSFCERFNITKCNFEIKGSAELRDVEKDRANGELYCLFG